jgi:hypothetical protein
MRSFFVPRRRTAFAALLFAALAIAPAAAPVDGVADHYTARWESVSPVVVGAFPTVAAGKPAAFKLRIFNCPTLGAALDPCGLNVSGEPITTAVVTLPQGFVVDPASASATNGWEPDVRPLPDSVHDVIELEAPTGSTGLLPGDSVTVTFTATPQSVGTVAVDTSATGLNESPMTLVGDEPSVNVVDVAGEPGTIVDCNGSGTCEGTASDGTTTVDVKATGTDENDVLTVALIARETERCEDFSGADGSKGGAFYVVDGGEPSTIDLTVTWRLDGKAVNLTELNGRKKFNVCFGGRNKSDPGDTFTTKSGGQSTPIAGVQWGLLPDCSPRFTEPCVSARQKTQAGDVILIFEVPSPWDPTAYGGP